MAILPIDNGRYGTKEMMEIFSEQKKVDYQLQIEGAAAISQSEIGIIPKAVGKKVFQAANSGKITAKITKNPPYITKWQRLTAAGGKKGVKVYNICP